MKTDPNVMEIFFRPFGNCRAHCRGSETFDSCLKLRLGMEESAIIQRLDHMQAGPGSTAGFKTTATCLHLGSCVHISLALLPLASRRQSSLLPRAIMRTSPSLPIRRIQPPGGRPGLCCDKLLLEDLLQY